MEACTKTAVLKTDLGQISVQEEVINKADKDVGYAFFKFEPFVLHMMCRSIDEAQTIVSASNSEPIICNTS